MDPVSQGVVGAVAAASLARDKETVRLAVLVGWAAGMLADADIFIRSEADPLLTIQYHRHFSHSLLFIPIGGLIAAAFWWVVFRGRKTFWLLLLFATAGYATAGLLDACTSYGTQLYWPFSDERVAWNIISIIDPIFTVTLVLLVLVGTLRKTNRWMHVAAGFALAYLLLGLIQNSRASRVQSELIAKRGHAETADMATVKPAIGNLVLWRSLYRHEGEFHADAIRVAGLGAARVYPGSSVTALDAEELKRGLPPESTLARDIDRFDHFSSRYLAQHPEFPEVVGDFRYSLLPNGDAPLWGIRYDRSTPDRHVDFESFRITDEARRNSLFAMILGREMIGSGAD